MKIYNATFILFLAIAGCHHQHKTSVAAVAATAGEGAEEDGGSKQNKGPELVPRHQQQHLLMEEEITRRRDKFDNNDQNSYYSTEKPISPFGYDNDPSFYDYQEGTRNLNTDQIFQFSSSAHACLLAYDMVQCVGYNYYGQLGQSSSDAFGTPVQLNFPNTISAKPIKVVTGYDHTCLLFNDKHVWCIGSNGFGQLGNGGTGNSSTLVQVKKNSVVLTNVIDIEAGPYHNCAIQDTGAMYCWGFDNKGQLGMNSIMDGSTNEKKAVKMALSLISTCVITGTEANQSKFATCVGKGFTSESVGSTTVDLVNGVLKLTAGSHHFCALLVGDTAKCWGANNAGQLGIGSTDFNPRYNTAEDVLNSSTGVALTGITDINAGYLSTCLVLSNGSPMCFGNNRSYQLGIANGGANVLYPTTITIALVSGKILVSLHVGESTGHAIYDDDSIYSMGTNNGGTFGDGSVVSYRNVVGDVSGAKTRQMKFSLGTNSPSNIPSLQPSNSPSLLHSDTPSLQPSSGPSLSPSLLPSDTPSLLPSSSPSLLPSDTPSLQHSSEPSSSPSDLPSLSPSSNPSLLPSDTPSLQLSNSPSLLPSDTPSLQHSSRPSDTPSLTHSSSPSLQASLSPSLTPSLTPSTSSSPSTSSQPSNTPTVNVARNTAGGVASQSSTGGNLGAGLAINGNYNSYSSTYWNHSNPWWRVQFSQSYEIQTIKIYFRANTGNRLLGSRLSLLHESQEVYESYISTTETPPNPIILSIQHVVGNQFKIQGALGGGRGKELQFTEVEVYGAQPPPDGPSASPSIEPSSLPSDNPSLSVLPSDTPSLQPSSGPSLSPTLLPSDTPSLQLSNSPSLLPSDTPSLQPSSGPSSSPSDLPSLSPSSNPSQDPYLLGDENSFITFDNVDFGSTNSIKGIKVTYANGETNGYGSVEIKLGDNASGTTLAQFSPTGTGSWVDPRNTMLIPFDNTVQLSGVNSLTFITSETTAVMHLISYELIDLSERFTPFTTINASEVSNQSGTAAFTTMIGTFDNGDYFTYSPIDFGLGANSIKITYSKAYTGGRLEIRKGDVNGEVIGNYSPASTGGWEVYQTVDIPIKTTFGINELTFVARDLTYGLMNLKSFQLSPVSAGYICLNSTASTQPESVQAATNAQTGTDLVSIRCGAQQNAVASLPITTGTWIGGTDAANEGTWVLPDGNAMTYSNWDTGEPNNYGGNQDCIEFGSNGLWWDGPCNSNTRPAIFESTFAIAGLTCNEYVECQDTVKIVENGIQTSDTRLRNSNLVTQTDSAGAYLSVPGSSTATTTDNWNVYNLPIGANDDFVMLAKLKVDGSGSAASFFINDLDNFGFDGSSNQIFTHSNSAFYAGFVQANKGTHHDNLFYFKVERKLGTIKFYINDEELASTANYNVAISRFFWRPWRADLKIYDWIVSGPSLLNFSLIDQGDYVCLQTEEKTYSDHAQAAQNAQTGANLVSIRCSEQQAKVNLLPLGASSWIGLNDINTEGAWVLADGHAMTYTNWSPNEPNNAGTGEDCAVVKSTGLWNDGGCQMTVAAVYESPHPIDGLSCEQYVECTTNVALSGTATASSAKYVGTSAAIDGNTASYFNSGTVTHTENETNPWWKVQLAQEYSIAKVIVYGRDEPGSPDNPGIRRRLNTFRMTVLLNGVEVFRYDDSASFSNVVTSIVVPSKIIGDAVQIQLFGVRVLSLAEVEVEGLCLHWTQVGASINGKAASDFFGDSLSLSADGRTVAVGANGNDDNGDMAGQNRVFRLSNSGLWQQLGQDLNGQAAGHQSGRAIALSPDGSTVAIGDPLKDSNGFSDNGDVRIFRFNESSDSWIQLGTNILGEGNLYQFGSPPHGMALSEDGNTIALGAWKYSEQGVGKGRVYVYHLTNGSWTLFGMSSPLLGEQEGDRFGCAIALSYDGETLAVGAPKNVNTGNVNSDSLESGHVRIFRYSSGSWQQLGSNLEGEGNGNMFGFSVALSSDGNTVASGGYNNGGNAAITGNANLRSGYVQVWHYLSGSWQQLGEDIDGEAELDNSGKDISLSSDGETVVIGANYNDGGGVEAGHARVYRYSNGSSWKQIGADIDGENAYDRFGIVVGISGDGKTVAISSRKHNSGTGHVRVYDLFGNCS